MEGVEVIDEESNYNLSLSLLRGLIGRLPFKRNVVDDSNLLSPWVWVGIRFVHMYPHLSMKGAAVSGRQISSLFVSLLY